ncbi:ABC transporter ATP-binding protein [Fusobacterium perfoetens]|uniref:ABC transporter ATP-binding protein n=1 Tax=Fusobacterium perfoetens TaxID=852 RepID=UPI001F2A8FE9|nr:ATP-binding cassette domain-containing protein [Fusobacterium perfoetens]MCF2613287.1 ATP-binding cassette domain-containing protein [Fusobacterium perfoetens]
MLSLRSIEKTFLTELGTEKRVFKGLNLDINNGEFITVIGSNGAGKSTLLNLIMGSITPDSGTVSLDEKDITRDELYKKNSYISKVYQDPSMGTAPSMTVFENLSMADNKGKKFNFSFGLNQKRKNYYESLLSELGLGIEKQMDTEVRMLSGGQRQCLALLMVTLNKPKLLLLDEHTAALDPKTSKIILDKTDEIVRKNNITTLMITHNLEDAITYGDRIIMLHEGEIILNVSGEEKKKLTPKKLLEKFQTVKGRLNDSAIFTA